MHTSNGEEQGRSPTGSTSDHPTFNGNPRSEGRERRVILALCSVWLVHLLLYVWAVPPWQHYDEPTHFEYALLIRELGRLPTLEEQLPALRRAIAVSMLGAGFYDRPDVPLPAPELDSPNLNLGINQRSVPPSYYTLVALATSPFRTQPIETQLYIGRLTSVALAVCLFWAAYALLTLLTGSDWSLRCWTLAVLVLQPAFADNMSAVSSDALANLVAVLFLLAGVYLLRSPNWRQLLILLAVALLGLYVKRTLIPFMLLIPLILFLILPGRARYGVLLAGAIAAIAACAALLVQPWPLASWFGNAASDGYVAADSPTPPLAGRAAFALPHSVGAPVAELHQNLPLLSIRTLADQQITVAAWMRSDRSGVRATTPVLRYDSQVISQSVTLDTSWRLVAFTTRVPAETRSMSVLLCGPLDQGVAFYDSVALVRGDTTQVPQHGAPDGSYPPGLLEGESARNLLRNSGAEQRIPPLPSALRLFSGRLLDETSFAETLATLSNPTWIAIVYPRQALLLFASAWGTFGWGEVQAPTGWFGPLGVLALGAVAGAIRFTLQASRAGEIMGARWRLWAWWLCLGAVLIGWGVALLRVHSQPFPGAMFWSFGRYTFVSMVPGMLVFVTGLRDLFPHKQRTQGLAGVVIFLLIFALVVFFGTLLSHYSARFSA